MPETLEIPALLPALPEIVLVVGAMALLMVGAFRGEESSRSIDAAAILLLILTGVVIVLLPAGTLVTFGGSFVVDNFARFLKLLALTGSAAAILMSTDYLAAAKRQRFEYSILILLATECTHHQQRHRAERKHDFRQSREQRGNFERFGHRRTGL